MEEIMRPLTLAIILLVLVFIFLFVVFTFVGNKPMNEMWAGV
jgi:uncharacterized protein YqfA (UPF0365 family)